MNLLIGAAFAALLALALATVITGVITALKVHHHTGDDQPD
ncbi:hypothetical protein GCM10009639_13300 [Kitasatospora putterlickiae]|uniref:Uncharacterized protein n=1 Tax=Kitasatospora putterlickiae TaxID=221725 RepID=A0ABN1XQS1_9ACTN